MFVQNLDDDNLIEDQTNMMTLVPPIQENEENTKIENFGNFDESTTDTEVNHIIESIRMKLDQHREHGFVDDQCVFNSI